MQTSALRRYLSQNSSLGTQPSWHGMCTIQTLTTGRRAMARLSSKRSKRTQSASSRRKTANGNGKTDAISLLKADHREVEKWFGQFEKTDSPGKKQELANKICTALQAH